MSKTDAALVLFLAGGIVAGGWFIFDAAADAGLWTSDVVEAEVEALRAEVESLKAQQENQARATAVHGNLIAELVDVQVPDLQTKMVTCDYALWMIEDHHLDYLSKGPGVMGLTTAEWGELRDVWCESAGWRRGCQGTP